MRSPGPFDSTRQKLRIAASIVAAGFTLTEAAEAVKTTRALLARLCSRHPDLWSEACKRAKAAAPTAGYHANPAAIVKASPPPDPADGYGGQLLRDFLFEVYLPSRPQLKPGSIELLEKATELLDQWAGDRVAVGELTEGLISRFLRHYASSHAAATTNSKRRMLLTLWRAAHKRGLAPPPADIPKVKEPKRLPEAWRVDEVARILARCGELEGIVGDIPANHWWASLVLVCYDTAGRIGAILQTRPEDVDLASRTVFLRASTQKQQADQLLYLSAQAVDALALIYDPDRDLVWPWPFKRRWLYVCFRRQIINPAGVRTPPGGRQLFHRLRRTSLSYMAKQDVRLAVEAAGHSDEKITRGHYIDQQIAVPDRRPVDCLPRPGGGPLLRVVTDAGDNRIARHDVDGVNHLPRPIPRNLNP